MDVLKEILECLVRCGVEAEIRKDRIEPYVNVGDVKSVKNRMQFWYIEKNSEVHMYIGTEMGKWYNKSKKSVYLKPDYRYSFKENRVEFPNINLALQFIEEVSKM
ncbi:MAG: hypothetical protein IJ619_06475 [Eubacterium sp.]|nr:hypothetical protein [Eubacterium sp.]